MAVVAAHADFVLEERAGTPRLSPIRQRVRHVIGVGNLVPTPALAESLRLARILIPTLVEPVDGAVGIHGPDDLRQRLGQGTEPLLALA